MTIKHPRFWVKQQYARYIININIHPFNVGVTTKFEYCNNIHTPENHSAEYSTKINADDTTKIITNQ